MAGNTGRLKIEIHVDPKDGKIKIRQVGTEMEKAGLKGERAFNRTDRSVGDMNRRLASSRSAMLALGSAVASIAAVYALGRISQAAIKAASDLEEVSSKFNVVFKGQTAVAEKWSKALVDSYAMSTREAKQYLSSVQDLLKPMGMEAEAAGRLSNEIVKLSADLGSFNNLPTAQVMADIQSALVGNYETMKKYGVVLNATVVQEEALAMGLAKTKDELTAAHRAQAAYKLMVEGSQDAIGDMARTSGSYANQLKQLKASVEDLAAAIGENLLPAATAIISVFNKWAKALEKINAGPDVLDLMKKQAADARVQVMQLAEEIRKAKEEALAEQQIGEYMGHSGPDIAELENKLLYWQKKAEQAEWSIRNIEQQRAMAGVPDVAAGIVSDIRGGVSPGLPNAETENAAYATSIENRRVYYETMNEILFSQTDFALQAMQEKQARELEAELAFAEEKKRIQWAGIQAQMNAEYALEKAVEDGLRRSVASHKRAEQEKARVQRQTGMQALSNAAYFFKEMGEKNRAAFEAFKVISATQVMIKAIESAQNIYAAISTQAWLGPLAPVAATAAAMAALMAGVARANQIRKMQPGGTASASGGGGGAVGTYPASPTTGLPPMPEAQAEEAPRQISLSIHVYGNVVDHDKFARELVPSISKAIGDGVQ